MTPNYSFGQYRITRKLGEGAMGEVFLGIDTMLDREVALKTLRSELARQPQVVERFRAEARILAQMRHPNIAAVYTMVRESDCYCMVMEYVPGVTLQEHLRRNGQMRLDESMRVFGQVLAGVEHAHCMGVVHRDLKPANLMLTPRGEVKVMDFGIARALGTARMTSMGRAVGTLEYMSPEQVRGLETTVLSDIYSLAIVLYEMLTGRVPFRSNSEFELMRAQLEALPEPPRIVAPWIPQPVEWALIRALDKRPENRFRSTAEFWSALMPPSVYEHPAAVTQHSSAPPTRIAAYPVISGPGLRTHLQARLRHWKTVIGDSLVRVSSACYGRFRLLPRRHRLWAGGLTAGLIVLCMLILFGAHHGNPARARQGVSVIPLSRPAMAQYPPADLRPPSPEPAAPSEPSGLRGSDEPVQDPPPEAAPPKPKPKTGLEDALKILKQED